jgi:hypothetical protein
MKSKLGSSRFFFVFVCIVLLHFGACLRVENLRVVNSDAFSITFEWSIHDTKSVPPGSAAYSAEEVYEKSREQYELLIEPSLRTTTVAAAGGGGGASSSAEVNDEWIGFKIKYFTEKLQYPPILLKNVNLRKFRLENLKPNTEYKIQVSAFNKIESEGPASNLLVIRTQDAGLLR